MDRPPQHNRPPRAPTIIDVAALAGVSKSTVSNVVRGADGVSPGVRARVVTAVEQLGYRPNTIARQLVHQRTNVIGVLSGNLDNPFHGEMAARVVQASSLFGFTAVFYDIEGGPGMAVAGVESLLQQRVAGIVFQAIFGSAPAIQTAVGGQLPVVFVGLRESWADSVAVDDRRSTRMATEYLLGLGHRRVTCLTTPGVERTTADARAAGYRAAMRAAGLQPRQILRWNPDTGHVLIGRRSGSLEEELLGSEAPTAVVCSNDMGAIALLEFADRLRIAVPERLSVVGFDNVHLAGLARISLTTVAQPLNEMARLGVETIVARIRGDVTGPPRGITPPTELIVRGSTAPPRRGTAR